MRENYGDLIEYVRDTVGVSWNRSRMVLKEYSEVLKRAVKRGYSIDIDGLVDISFTTAQGYIYKNSVYGLDEQIQDVVDALGLDEFEVRNIVTTYLKRIRTRLKDGYHVNIKGICYLIPEEVDGAVMCTTRISPVLSKPEIADFLLTTDRGIVMRELAEKDLRFNIREKEDITYLYEVVSEERQLDLKEVEV